jgi:microcystin-dependent protein
LPPVIAIPPGAVMPFVGQNAPVGWLICDGSYVPNGNGTVTQNGVPRSYNFGPLYTALGTTYGPEVGGQRKLPDLRGYFVRGFGSNEDATSSGTFGQKQADAFQGHKHGIHDPKHGHTGSTSTDGKHTHPLEMANDESVSGVKIKEGEGFVDAFGRTGEDGEHSHTVSIVTNSTDVKVLHPTADTATPGMTPADSNGPGGTPRTSNETRPRNIAMLYCVKY